MSNVWAVRCSLALPRLWVRVALLGDGSSSGFWAQPTVQSPGPGCEDAAFPFAAAPQDVCSKSSVRVPGRVTFSLSAAAGLWGPPRAVPFEALSSCPTVYSQKNELFPVRTISASAAGKQHVCLYFPASKLACKIKGRFLMKAGGLFLLMHWNDWAFKNATWKWQLR